jgi:hypothetical protein
VVVYGSGDAVIQALPVFHIVLIFFGGILMTSITSLLVNVSRPNHCCIDCYLLFSLLTFQHLNYFRLLNNLVWCAKRAKTRLHASVISKENFRVISRDRIPANEETGKGMEWMGTGGVPRGEDRGEDEREERKEH